MDKLISQQAAIDVVAKWIFEVFGIKESDGTATVFKRLRELPSAQPDPCEDAVSRQAAIYIASGYCHPANIAKELAKLPSVQPDIIRCKDCKHWNPQLKTANGNGLGSCDFHNVALVTSEGFCYWAERGEQNDSEAD